MFCPFHSFDVTFEEAKHIQNELRKRVEISDTISNTDELELIGGADVAFIDSVGDSSQEYITDTISHYKNTSDGKTSLKSKVRRKNIKALAGIVILDVKQGSVVETACTTAEVPFPYVPGYLSFREGPAILAAIGELSLLPGVMIYDGCGIAHPRGLGLASHMGILTGIPSIGCAKSLLCGICKEPGNSKGNWTEITYNEKVVGACLRTRDNVKPVYVSPGSGFSVRRARELILSLAWKYRLPEPTRLAHNLVTSEKRMYNINC